MAIEDYFDPYDEYDDYDDRPSTCNYCGALIEWSMVDGKWKPISFVTGKPHLCKAFLKAHQAEADDFEGL